MNKFKGLETKEEYNLAIELIEKYDQYVNLCYNELQKTADEVKIVEIQDFIIKLKTKRNALFIMTEVYKQTVKSDSEIATYIVRKGDTLALIAQLYYQNHEFAEYIYYYNELDDWELIPFQELKIPLVHPEQILPAGSGSIRVYDNYLVRTGND